jgi:hypothetical protein
VIALAWQKIAQFRSDDLGQGHRPDALAAGLYRSGLHAWQTRSPSGLARAEKDFSEAIKRDPHYAEAYAGLAGVYDLEGEFTTVQPDRAYPAAAAAARHAIALDSRLADAHAALRDGASLVCDISDGHRRYPAGAPGNRQSGKSRF